MEKRYIMTGFVENILKVEGKDKVYTCKFENGAVSGLGCIPASFTTNNAEVQRLLENRDDFKNGRIRLAAVYGEPEDKKVEGSEAREVTTLQGARAYLLEQGATMEELQNKVAVLEKAKELNIVFPNWK